MRTYRCAVGDCTNELASMAKLPPRIVYVCAPHRVALRLRKHS